ncbi:MAG: tetratricopeptide repeat protein, partial [Bacteroidota bacterium]
DSLDEAESYLKQATKHYEASSYDESISLVKQAIPIYQALGDIKDKVKCEALLCYNFLGKGEPNEALRIAQQLTQDISDQQGEHYREKCELADILGEASLSLGRNNEALTFFEESLHIYQSSKQEDPLLLARIYNHLGLLYWNNGSWDLALEHQLKAYNLRKNVHGSLHPDIAASLNDIGLIYSSKEDLNQARKYYSETLDMYEKLYPARHPKIANGLVNLAIIQRQDSSFSDALSNLEKSLEIWQEIYQDDHPKIAFIYSNIGRVYQGQKQNTVALEYQKRALGIYQKNYGDRHPDIANTYNLMGLTYQNQEKWSEAREAFHQALLANYSREYQKGLYELLALQNYYNADILRSSLHMKALASEGLHLNRSLKAKDLKSALLFIEQCDTLIQEIRQTRSNKGDKLSLGAGARRIYEDGIRICFRLAKNNLNPAYYHRKAFYFSEQSKAT